MIDNVMTLSCYDVKIALATAEQIAKEIKLSSSPVLAPIYLVNDINSVTNPDIGALYIQRSETETDIETKYFVFTDKDNKPIIYRPPTKIKKEIKDNN